MVEQVLKIYTRYYNITNTYEFHAASTSLNNCPILISKFNKILLIVLKHAIISTDMHTYSLK